jgi:hypothetical protein
MEKTRKNPALVYVKRWKARNFLTKWEGTIFKVKAHESWAIIWKWGDPYISSAITLGAS